MTAASRSSPPTAVATRTALADAAAPSAARRRRCARRVAYAAAHVVADPLGDNVPGAPAAVDWDATLAFRRHLWSHGLGVAEAMDTAQRGMGLDWAATRELIRRSAAEAARRRPARWSPAASAPTTSPDAAIRWTTVDRRLRGAAARRARRPAPGSS